MGGSLSDFLSWLSPQGGAGNSLCGRGHCFCCRHHLDARELALVDGQSDLLALRNPGLGLGRYRRAAAAYRALPFPQKFCPCAGGHWLLHCPALVRAAAHGALRRRPGSQPIHLCGTQPIGACASRSLCGPLHLVGRATDFARAGQPRHCRLRHHGQLVLLQRHLRQDWPLSRPHRPGRVVSRRRLGSRKDAPALDRPNGPVREFPPGGHCERESAMNLAKTSVALLVIQLTIFSLIAAKYLYQRWTCPRVWTRTVVYDPELLMRGRYLSEQLIVDGCQSTLPSARLAITPKNVEGMPVGTKFSVDSPGPVLFPAQIKEI